MNAGSKGQRTDIKAEWSCRKYEEVLARLEAKEEHINMTMFQFKSKNQIVAFTKLLGKNTALLWLCLANASLGSSSGKLIAQVLNQNNTLQYLNVYMNDMGTGLIPVLKSLQENHTLEVLFMGGNVEEKQSGAVANALAEMLEKNSTLLTLGCSSNALGDKGCAKILASLQVNRTLLTLVCSSNGMSTEGAKSLAYTLKRNHTLTKLNLKHNKLEDDAVKILGKSLKQNETLTYLDMTNSCRGPEAANLLKKSLKENRGLVYFGTEIKELQETTRMFANRNEMLRQEAFASAMDGENKAAWRRSKLMVVGEGMAGKTATVHSILDQPFNPEWDSTVGVNLSEAKAMSNGKWKLDTTQNIAAKFGAMIAMENLEVQKVEREERLKKREKELAEEEKQLEVRRYSNLTESTVGTENNSAPVVVVEETTAAAAPTRQSPRPTNLEQDKGVAREKPKVEYNKDLFEAEIIDPNALIFSIWDYGGQSVFDSLHQMFFTNYGLYLLVFDSRVFQSKGSKKQKQKEEQVKAERVLQAWLASIKMFAPEAPVMFVGTFGDETMESVGAIKEAMRSVCKGLQLSPENIPTFLIDNKTKSGVAELKMELAETTLAQAYIEKQVPVKWILCLDEFLANKEEWLRLKDVQELAASYNIKTSQEVEDMLSFLNEMGMISYFNQTEVLREFVTLKPQWLIDSISTIIRDPKLHTLNQHDLKRDGMVTDVDKFFATGILNKDLLQYLWKSEAIKTDFLIDLTRNLLLISQWKFNSSDTDFLVPALAPDTKIACKGVRCSLTFPSGFVPKGVFERLVCTFVEYSAACNTTVEPTVSRSACKVHLGNAIAVFLEKAEDGITYRVEDSQHASRCLKIFVAMIKKVKQDIMGKVLRYEIDLEKEGGEFETYQDAKAANLMPWFPKDAKDDETAGPVLPLDNFVLNT